jgi:hypothetical protein
LDAGNDGLTGKVDDLGRLSAKGPYLLVRAHRHDTTVLDGKTLSDGEILIDGDHMAVDEKDVRIRTPGNLLRSGTRQPRQDEK